jgi:hypothetical protein
MPAKKKTAAKKTTKSVKANAPKIAKKRASKKA